MNGVAAAPAERRRTGPLGTAVRVLLGMVSLVLPIVSEPPGLVGGVQGHDLVLGWSSFLR